MSRRQRLGRLGLFVCYTLLCLWSFSIAADLSVSAPAMSLRYTTRPLGPEEAQDFIDKTLDTPYNAVLWRWEKDALFDKAKSADVLLYYGEGAYVYPASFVEGGYPSAVEERGLALSVPLADALFGSQKDLLGQPVEYAGETYYVRGIFKSEEMFAMAASPPDKNGPSYTGVALTGPGSKQEALVFMRGSGLREPEIFLDFPLLVQIAWLLAWLGPCVGGCMLLWRGLRARGVPRRWIGYVLFIVACLGCGTFLSFLPAWLVPSRWSDFTFWSDLASQFGQDARQWLSLGADIHDMQIKLKVFSLVPAAALSLAFSVKLAISPGRKTNTQAVPSTPQAPYVYSSAGPSSKTEKNQPLPAASASSAQDPPSNCV
ncbi:MAG: hypothetical protein Q4G07_03065 [Oscillospiraceae bacterium]|nr:hypothetical protein [Oscillospiraceae bacterium]